MLRISAILFMVLVLASCRSDVNIPTEASPESVAPEAPTGALDQMELVFEGDYSREEIQAKLEQSFVLYDMEPTEANYRRAGDVLVALSNNAMEEQGCEACTEMAILDYLIQSGRLDGVEWHEAAALSSSFLWAEGQ